MSETPKEWPVLHATLKGAAIGAGIGLAIEAGRALNVALDRLDRITVATETAARRGGEENEASLLDGVAIIRHAFASIRRRAIGRGLFTWRHGRRNDFDHIVTPEMVLGDGDFLVLSEVSAWLMSLRRWNGLLLESEAALAMLDGQLDPLRARQVAGRGGTDNPLEDWLVNIRWFHEQARQWNNRALWNLFETLRDDNTLLLQQMVPDLFRVPREQRYPRYCDGLLIAMRSAAETCRAAVAASGQTHADGGLDLAGIPLLANRPGRYRVKGVRKQTAAEVVLVLKAHSQAVANLIADALGIAVVSIGAAETAEVEDRSLDEDEIEMLDRELDLFADLVRGEASFFMEEIDEFKPDFMVR